MPQWLEPSLSDAALAEEEGLDRLKKILIKEELLFHFLVNVVQVVGYIA